MLKPSRFTVEEALEIGGRLGVKWEETDLEQFRRGLEVELEHGRRSPLTDVTGDDPVVTGKIALAHLREVPDYYSRLDSVMAEAVAFWRGRRTAATRGFAGEDAC